MPDQTTSWFKIGETQELTVSVEPVPGEEIEENNTLTTEVTWE